MSNLNLRTKLILGLAIPILFLIALAVLSITTTRDVEARFTEVNETDLAIVNSLNTLKFESSRILSSTNEYVLDGVIGGEEEEGGELGEIAEAVESYEGALADLKRVLETSDHEAQLFANVETAGALMIELSTTITALEADELAEEDASELREELEDAERALLVAVEELLAEEEAHLAEGQEDVEATATTATSATLVLGALATLLTVVFSFYLARSILTPLNKLSVTADSIRAGNLTVRSDVTSGDEFGKFAATFNEMAEAIEYRDKVQITRLEEQVVEAQTAREAAEKSDRVKSAFLASMSHELRTPLNAVINLTKFVAQGDLGPVNPEQEETLMESVDSARHLLNLINDVLDMSKIEAGSLNLFVRDDVDLAKIIDSMTVTARSLIGEKTIEIRTEISPDLPHIRADEQRIRQILLNMIANATKFTEEGYIEIRAHTENSHVIIAVEDSGPGISVQDQEAVFEAFKQTDSGLRKGGGTGLGMPISKNLAEIHGGKLWLDSGTGKGSTFFVSLPIRSDDLTPAL